MSDSDIEVTSEVPVPKRYAHHGKKRLNYESAMVRCQVTDMIGRTPLICNHLLWRKNPEVLREHLTDHMKVEDLAKLDDSQVEAYFTDAKRIFLEGIPEDEDDIDGESLDDQFDEY